MGDEWENTDGFETRAPWSVVKEEIAGCISGMQDWRVDTARGHCEGRRRIVLDQPGGGDKERSDRYTAVAAPV